MGDFAYVNYLHLCRVSTYNEAEIIYCMQLPVVYTILTHTHTFQPIRIKYLFRPRYKIVQWLRNCTVVPSLTGNCLFHSPVYEMLKRNLLILNGSGMLPTPVSQCVLFIWRYLSKHLNMSQIYTVYVLHCLVNVDLSLFSTLLCSLSFFFLVWEIEWVCTWGIL